MNVIRHGRGLKYFRKPITTRSIPLEVEPSAYSLRCSNGFATRSYLFSRSNSSIPHKATTTPGDKSRPTSQSTAPKTQTPSPDTFRSPFRDLKMSRGTKLIVYGAIGVLATVESIFWCKVIWRWWTGSEEE
ncbi:hypothetical protein GGS20DRAFT_572643 [Poronia punctata]|nr:hypothetical protein GGS20DRAFT_572643 [Poronia punctata]